MTIKNSFHGPISGTARYDPSDRGKKIIEEFAFTVRPIGPWKPIFGIPRYDPSDAYRYLPYAPRAGERPPRGASPTRQRRR
jgi:hypothetical protein